MSTILDQFITNVDELHKKGTPTATLVTLVELGLTDLLKHPNLLSRNCMLLPPGLQNVAHLLYMGKNESWTLEAFVWKSGAMTPIHDHGVWGVVGQYLGAELDIRYTMLRGNVQEDWADLAETGRTPMMPGNVITLLPPDDIHQVKSISAGTSVSIHVYGGNIRKIDRYEFDLNTGKITIDRRR